MQNVLGFANTLAYVWLIPIIFTIHEVEEWNILKWYQTYYKDIPESTNTSIRIHIVVLSVVAFILTGIAYLLSSTFLFSLIVAFLSAFIVFNVTQHVIWTVQLKAYSPGLVTGILGVAVVLFANAELILNGHMRPWFYAIAVLTIFPIIKTLKVKGEMTPEVRNVHNFFIKVEKALRRSTARSQGV